MTGDPAQRKTFMLRLSTHYIEYFRMYAFVHRHLLERLGRDAVEALWKDAQDSFEDGLFLSLIKDGWSRETESTQDLRSERRTLVEKLFAPAVQGVAADDATEFLLGIGPFRQIDAAFPELTVQRESTTYEALHLLVHGLALFAEAAIARVGKAAEFMIYDALMEEIEDRLSPEITGREWVKAIYDRNQSKPADAPKPTEPPRHTIGSAGHVEEVVRVAEDELIVHMTQCSWADYYLDRHPGVGPLLGCCVDDPVFRRTAKGLRLQRQFTLMEHGPYCDFRFYSAE